MDKNPHAKAPNGVPAQDVLVLQANPRNVVPSHCRDAGEVRCKSEYLKPENRRSKYDPKIKTSSVGVSLTRMRRSNCVKMYNPNGRLSRLSLGTFIWNDEINGPNVMEKGSICNCLNPHHNDLINMDGDAVLSSEVLDSRPATKMSASCNSVRPASSKRKSMDNL